VILTNPQIGNYGTSSADNESKGPYIEGLVVREFSPIADAFLTRAGVPIASDLDTRALVPFVPGGVDEESEGGYQALDRMRS
jgi:carbamoyl-phosphate synthase small subunit